MEDPTRFDLNSELLAWKQEIARQPGISADEARELETHLLECFANFKRQGLNEAEAFQAACRQLGPAETIAREFARSNPARVWRDRVFWMALAGFAFSLWQLLASQLVVVLGQVMIKWGVNIPFALFPVASAVAYLPLFIVAVMIATGRLSRSLTAVEWCVQKRSRLAGIGLTAFVVVSAIRTSVLLTHRGVFAGSVGAMLLIMAVEPLTLLSVLLLVLSKGDSRTLSGPMRVSSGLQRIGIWRDRVLWMAFGGLVVGLWGRADNSAMVSLFYTGDLAHQYKYPLLISLGHLLIFSSPMIFGGILVASKRSGSITSKADRWLRSPRRIRLIGLQLLLLWIGCWYLGQYVYFSRTHSYSVTIVAQTAAMFSWLWPIGLTTLIIWLAPTVQQSSKELPSQPAAR